MKPVKMIFPFLFVTLLLAACGPKDQQGTASGTREDAEEANDDKFETNKGVADADFVVEAVNSKYAEIEMAQLAGQRSDNREIKEIARLLENEHNELLKDLQTFASKKAISIPTENDDATRREIEALNKKDNIRDFNKKWCKEMVNGHEEAIENFEERLQKTEDPDLKELVNKALPQLRTHVEKLRACEQKIAEANY